MKPACWRITNAMSNGQEETNPKSLEIGAGLRIQGITQVFRSLLIERAVSSLFLPTAVLAMAGCWMFLVGDWYEYLFRILYVGSSRTSFHVIACRQETQRFGTLVRRLGRANERTVDHIWLTFILGQEIYKSTGP